jgi:hypothetical protein
MRSGLPLRIYRRVKESHSRDFSWRDTPARRRRLRFRFIVTISKFLRHRAMLLPIGGRSGKLESLQGLGLPSPGVPRITRCHPEPRRAFCGWGWGSCFCRRTLAVSIQRNRTDNSKLRLLVLSLNLCIAPQLNHTALQFAINRCMRSRCNQHERSQYHWARQPERHRTASDFPKTPRRN